MHRTSISKEVDHTNIKITTEKSIEGIRFNSQSFSTIPCLASILEKKVGSIRSIDGNKRMPKITFFLNKLLAHASLQVLLL
jgi:hypothetical protein